jgi:hypothetical protein
LTAIGTTGTYFVLDLANVWCDLAAWHSFHDKLSRHARFCLANIFGAEQELAVEVRYVNGVHVDNVDVAEARQSQVLEDLASKTTSTNDQESRSLTDSCN